MNEAYSFNIHQSGMLLTDEKLTHETKLNVIHHLKNHFNNATKTFSNVSLSTLLDNTITLQTCGNQDSNFLFSYGESLIAYYGEDSTLDSKIVLQIEVVLLELNEKCVDLFDTLIKKFWERLEIIKQYSQQVISRIMKFSKNYLEEVVLNWIESENPINSENYYVNVSTFSVELYQSITGILYQVLVCSNGNSKILEVLETFVSSVFFVCKKFHRNFLKLYPREYNAVVSLIMNSPEMLPDEGEILISKDLIANVLFDKLINDNKHIMMLMSHFPKWLCFVQDKVKKNLI